MFGLIVDWIDRLRWGKIPQRELDLARKRADEISEYKEGVGWVLKPGVKLISVDEDIAEWRKDPGFARRADEKIAKLLQEIEANKARKARRKAMVAKLRGVGAKLRRVWANLTRGIGDGVL